jgi:hypothetical protein
MAGNGLSMQKFNRYRVRRPGEKEGFRDSLYDFVTYEAAGQTELRLFAVPYGASGKSKQDTNLGLAGQLSAGQQFLALALAIEFFPGVNPVTGVATNAVPNFLNDVWAVGKSGWLEFKIGDKIIVEEGPLGNFPPAYRMECAAAISAGNNNAATLFRVSADYAAWGGPLYRLSPPVTFESNQAFTVTMRWNSPVPLPSATAGRIGIRFLGQKARDV